MKLFTLLFLLLNIIPIETLGIDKKKFLSTKFNEVNVRNGPGKNHIINLKLLKKGIPVKIIDEYESWYRVLDFSGDKGWISKNQLSKQRYGLIIVLSAEIKIFPTNYSKVKAILYKNVIFKILKCHLKWCKVSIKNNTGWIEKKKFWGVENNEKF